MAGGERFKIISGNGQTSAASWSEWANNSKIRQILHNFRNKNQRQNELNSPLSSSSSSNTKTLGITSILSNLGPDPVALLRTKQLEETLKKYDIFESDIELNHRMKVLCTINNLFKQWIKDISLKKKFLKSLAEIVGGKIFTFGSYRLGVHTKGADIDILCVAPRHIERKDFFGSFVELLKQQSEVKDLRSIEDAYVPVIKMTFDGIELDVVFARLAMKCIPEDQNLRDVNLLKNLDPVCVRSLNGCRVTDEILNLVPNKENFKLALSAIKLWAKRQGIYSNAMGYLGGVSWAILLARTCQLYPNAAPATLVNKFYRIFSLWSWPNPVLLKQPDQTTLGFPVWDPRINPSDRHHLMPIISPAYPQRNTSFNASLSTRKVIRECFKLGETISNDIMLGKENWSKLFEAPNFFAKYKSFIMITISASTKEHHLEWNGLCQAKIRLLVGTLERYSSIDTIHLNPETFSPVEQESNKIQSMWFIGLKFKPIENVTLKLDFTSNIQHFTNIAIEHAIKNNIFKKEMKIEAKYVKQKELKRYLPPTVLNIPKKKVKSNVRSNSTPQNNPNTPSINTDIKSNKSSILTSSNSNLSVSVGFISPHKRKRDSNDIETECKHFRSGETGTPSVDISLFTTLRSSAIKIPFIEEDNEAFQDTINDSPNSNKI